LAQELSHRVKNTLAVIQAIATQTKRGATDLEQFFLAFEGRLRALSEAHTLLTGGAREHAELSAIVNAALAAFDVGTRVHIDGPPVRLTASPTVALTLMLHELATNATKYGALSKPAGRVDVVWRDTVEEGHAWILLTWRERDGPPVVPPQSQGFGSRLLAASAQQLGGSVATDYLPDGLNYSIRFPNPAESEGTLLS
jgi:two-component sensor histidine kinase